jgi:hypothetical protein
MSAQYLENLSLDCYDISYVGWWWVEEDPYWFWGQRSNSFKTGNRNILSTQYLENPLLDRLQTFKIHWYVMNSRWLLLILRFKGQEVKLDIGIYWLINILRTLCLTDFKL